MVELSPHYPKVKGLISAIAAGTRRDNDGQKGLAIFMNGYIHQNFVVLLSHRPK